MHCSLLRSIAASGDPIPLASEVHELDFEVELVIVIGKRAKRVTEEAALAHVRDEVEPICDCKCAVIGPLKRY